MAIWFVYRSHYEGPLSRRVRRLRADSVLGWFQARLAEALTAKSEDAAHEVGQDELGGSVYGFGTYFKAAREHGLKPPGSVSTLKRHLREHLYVEGDADDCIRLDGHGLRVCTDDDEVQLAYYFFDDQIAADRPDQVAWLLHQEPRLPEVPADFVAASPYAPPDPHSIKELACDPPAPAGTGVTYACLLTFCDGDSLHGQTVALPGVRLPGLAAHLRAVTPVAAWPLELRLLRAMTSAEEPTADSTIAGALTRAGRYPLMDLQSSGDTSQLGLSGADAAREEFAAAMPAKHGGDPDLSIVHAGEHAALLCAHLSTAFGYQQWVLFDDIWAAAHPDLATSLLRYTVKWDPFPQRTAAAKAKARAKDPAQAAARLVEAKARSQERAFTQALAGREGPGRAYQPGATYVAGEVMDHGKFGPGVVHRVDGKYIEVCFKDATRRLIHTPAVIPPPPVKARGYGGQGMARYGGMKRT